MSSAISLRLAEVNDRIAAAAGRAERRKRTGPEPLPPGEARTHVVSVRLNDEELLELDRQRAHGGPATKRGEWLRMSWLDIKPEAQIPALNAEAYAGLARSAANLNQIAKYLNEGGDIKGRMQILEEELADFRRRLICAQESIQ